jgi:hypothetical protein
MFQHDGYFRPLPPAVANLVLYTQSPEEQYQIRARIGGIIRAPDGGAQMFATCRTLMDRLRFHTMCPRTGCQRNRCCSSPHAVCMFENLETLQEFVFPVLKQMHGK